jgi:oligosaccharide 4-alpha-D-glucosyltransferase
MSKKIRPYAYLSVFLVIIFILFRLTNQFVSGEIEQRNSYTSHIIAENRLIISTTLGSYNIEYLNPSIASVIFTPAEMQPIDSSHAVILHPDRQSISFIEQDDQLKFKRGDFEIVINKNPFRLSFYKNGKLTLSEATGYFRGEGAEGFRFNLTDDEKIYGAGFRTTPTNRRGHRYELYNQAHFSYNLNSPNLNFSVPFVISSKGYGLLFDNAARGWLDLDVYRQNIMEFSAIGGKMSYYVVAQENYDSLLYQYGKLTGFQPMPPRWALGNIQSKFGYRTQQETEEIVDTIIAGGYPLDAIIIDLFWFGQGKHGHWYMGDLDWYAETWPEPEKMIQRFSDQGVKTVLITEPFVLQESKNFEPLSKLGYLVPDKHGETFVIQDFWFGLGGLINIFKPEAQQWFWDKYKAQNEIGVAGWWGDLGEPEKHPSEMVHPVGTADEVHNIYAHYWHKMLWDYYEQDYPDVRLFNLNRAGFAGSQRFSIYPWSGDVSRDWPGFQAQPTAVLGMTLSGFSYMHSDLGGFALGAPDEELYVRWMQYGVFNPVYRPHGDTNAPVEPVFYSDKAQEVLREYIKLRYKMLPYNYSLAWLNSTKGTPLTRPLFFEEPDNLTVAEIDDTYLWGHNILVAPILEKGQQKRRFYMPEGVWYDFFTGEKHTGGEWKEVDATFENIPAFAKGGSFIPMIEPIQTTDEYTSDNMIINFYHGPDVTTAEFVVYEDDGKTKYAYEKELYELLKLKAVNMDDDVTLFTFARETHQKYDGMPESRNIDLIVHGIDNRPKTISLGNKPVRIVPSQSAYSAARAPVALYDQTENRLFVRFNWHDEKVTLQLEF